MPPHSLRVVGGSAKGLPISQPKGVRLRPTSGLVREALFNIVGDVVEDARVLDIYAGTGALGIEALSRGASTATFVDAEAACCQAILNTLSRAGFKDRSTVIRGRLPAALSTLHGPFDLILMDPPYGDATEDTLSAAGPLLGGEGMFVYEHGSRYNPPERPPGLRQVDRRVYGDSALTLYAAQE